MPNRNPVKIYGTGLQEISTAEKAAIVDRMVYLYYTDPSITLSVVASGGNLGSISDTRKQAGASNTDVTNYDTEAETANISTVTVNHARMSQSVATLSQPTDTNSIRFPLYQSGGNLHSMPFQDMIFTFASEAMSIIITDKPYKIHTSQTSPTGYTLVSASIVFQDTIANLAAYTVGGIGETLDQPTTYNNYYLHKKIAPAAGVGVGLMYVDTSGAIREYTDAQFDALLKETIRYTAVGWVNEKMRFFISTNTDANDGALLGTSMQNRIHDGTGNYQTRFVNANDYRAQEFPDGTASSGAGNYLKAKKYA